MRIVARALAWTGGALFVASLGVCAWFYFVTLGRPASGGGLAAFLADAGLVTLFAMHHSVFARDAVKRRLAGAVHALERSTYVWVASLLLIAVCRFWRPIGGQVHAARGPLVVVHVAIQAVGVWLIALAVAGLDPLELAGIRQATGTATKSEPLQMRGPYRLVRHPVYLGWMLLLFATPTLTVDRLAFAGLTSLYLVLAVPWEERALLKSFGDQYARYQRQVRWRMLPFVY
jgi:methanethiol S-methyltransferase